MTQRQFCKDVMTYIHEQTKTLDDQAYDSWLEQLTFEIEEERQRLDWSDENEE